MFEYQRTHDFSIGFQAFKRCLKEISQPTHTRIVVEETKTRESPQCDGLSSPSQSTLPFWGASPIFNHPKWNQSASCFGHGRSVGKLEIHIGCCLTGATRGLEVHSHRLIAIMKNPHRSDTEITNFEAPKGAAPKKIEG